MSFAPHRLSSRLGDDRRENFFDLALLAPMGIPGLRLRSDGLTAFLPDFEAMASRARSRNAFQPFPEAQLARQARSFFERAYAPSGHERRSCDAANAVVMCALGRSLSGSPLSDVHGVLDQVAAAR
jgi:hypothetical protein